MVERNKFYFIIARHCNKALDVKDRSTQNGANIQQWNYQSGRTNKHFHFEEADSFIIPTVTGQYPPANQIGDVDRLTGFQAPAEKTLPILLGEVLIPFVLIQDGLPEVQVCDNPYYKLSRYGYWKRVFYYEHDGITEYEHQGRTISGLTITSAETIQTTTNMSIGADAGLKFQAVSIGVKGEICRNIQVTESTSQTLMKQTEVIVKRKWPLGVHAAQAVWFRADEYVLTRTDGSRVISWEIVKDQEFVSDVYPKMPL